MKNAYEICGEIAIIYLNRRDGSRLECYIEAKDLEKVKSFPGMWQCAWNSMGKSFYVRGNIKKNGKPNSLIFHRFLMDAPKGMQVDHINHNTLDNRRSNFKSRYTRTKWAKQKRGK